MNRNVTATWSLSDQALAAARGWVLCSGHSSGNRVARAPNSEIFTSDDAAHARVCARALAGYPIESKAMRLVAETMTLQHA